MGNFSLKMCMKWKDGKKLDVILVTNMDAWRQRLDKETKEATTETQRKIMDLQEQIDAKNTYLNSFKTEMAQTKRTAWDKDQQENKFAFDKVFAQYDHKIAGSIKYEDRTV